jgi:hypothetical protein
VNTSYLVAGILCILLGAGAFALDLHNVRAVGLAFVGAGAVVGAVDGPVQGHPTVGGVATVVLFGIGVVIIGGGFILRQNRTLRGRPPWVRHHGGRLLSGRQLVQDEDELLVEALGALGGRGAEFAARRLKKNVHEVDLPLPLAIEDAVERVYHVLAGVGSLVDTAQPEPTANRPTVRVITGGGAWGLNPVVVTAVLTRTEAKVTSVLLRAAVKEGLIKQRAGEKTAKRIAGLLTDQTVMEELPRGEPREEPTAAEAEFRELLEELLTPKLDFYFWTDRDGAPWVVAFLSFSVGPYPGIAGSRWSPPEGEYSLVKTLRLDFDSSGISGGWSIDNMDWDGDLRAEVAGVDTGPPEGIMVMAEGNAPAELARMAAEWFERHWADWEREGEKRETEKRRPGRRRGGERGTTSRSG